MFKKLLIISAMTCGMAFSYAQEATPEKCGCKQGTECICADGQCACKAKCASCDGCKKEKKEKKSCDGSGCKKQKDAAPASN